MLYCKRADQPVSLTHLQKAEGTADLDFFFQNKSMTLFSKSSIVFFFLSVALKLLQNNSTRADSFHF